MKNVLLARFKAGIVVLLAAGMIQACDRYYPSEASGSMSVSVSLADAKITAPDLSQDDFSFIITGDGPGDSTFHVETALGANTLLVENLLFGIWDITVEAVYHGVSGAVSFGDGTASVDVIPGGISACPVSITPFHGQGLLRITVNWNSASVQNPVLEGSLSRIGFDPVAVGFTMGSGQGTASMPLDSGIYRLSLVLKDGETYEFAGAADSIRIVNALTTSAVYTLTGQSGEGAIEVSISISIPSSMDPVITGGVDTVTQGASVALTGSAPAESGQVYYYWYLDGKLSQQGADYTVPSSLASGPHRVDLIVFNADYSRSGSITYLFTVVE